MRTRVPAFSLVLLLAPALAFGQLVDRRQGWNFTDKPLDPATQRRTVTYCVDPPPAGAPAGTGGAVDDAAAAWNALKSWPGGITLVRVAGCDTADIKVGWGQNRPSWGSTGQRGGAGNKGQMPIEIETRTEGGGWLSNQQIENIARHEFGHAKGLNDNAGSAGVMRPQAEKAGLAGADLPIGAVDIGANRSLNFDFYDVVRPPIDASVASAVPFGSAWQYTYVVRLAPTAVSPVREFNVRSPSTMSVVSLPPGWNAHFRDPETGKGGASAHYAQGTMACSAIPGFEIPPGGQLSFTFASDADPVNGWVDATDMSGEMAELGEVPNIVTPGGQPMPGSSPGMLLALAALLIASGAAFAVRRNGARSSPRRA